MRALRGGTWVVVFCAWLLAPTGIAQAALTIDTVASPIEVRSGETAQFTVTVGNTGPETEEQMEVGMFSLRAGGEKAVDNPYRSVSADRGTCAIDPVPEPPFNYTGATCQLGDVAAGESAQIIATVQVNESMDQLSSILDPVAGGVFVSDKARVRAIYPARVEGSSKIKLKGLPGSCVDRDFKLTASSKGAKKITAALAGPYDEWGGRPFGSGVSGKIAAEKGSKLKFEVPLGEERAGFYNVKLAAKFENGPKRKSEVFIQRCGDPFA